MKTPNTTIQFISLLLVCISFSQCQTTKSKMNITKTIVVSEKRSPQVYYQYWVAGVQGGGSGINLFFSKKALGGIVPQQIYFRNHIVKAEEKHQLYVARYKGKSNQLKDYGVNSSANDKNEDKVVETPLNFPFELLNNEAVISYLKNNKTEYLKFMNIPEKEMIPYPSAPPQR